METRFKYNKGSLWIAGIFFLIFTVLAFVVPKSWGLAVITGLTFFGGLYFYRTDKDNDLVIDEWGIHQVKGVDYKWYQIDHCYFERRIDGSVTQPIHYPYLIIVLKSGKKVPVSLNSYRFKKKALLTAIDEASGKSLCHKDDSDSQYEKVVWKKEYKSMFIGAIIALIFIFVWLLCMSVD